MVRNCITRVVVLFCTMSVGVMVVRCDATKLLKKEGSLTASPENAENDAKPGQGADSAKSHML